MKDASGTVEEILILVPGNAETGQAPSAGRLNPDNGFPGDNPSCGYAISIASFVDPTSNGLSRVFRTVLPSPSEMIANDRWFNHFRLITTPMISRIHD